MAHWLYTYAASRALFACWCALHSSLDFLSERSFRRPCIGPDLKYGLSCWLLGVSKRSYRTGRTYEVHVGFGLSRRRIVVLLFPGSRSVAWNARTGY